VTFPSAEGSGLAGRFLDAAGADVRTGSPSNISGSLVSGFELNDKARGLAGYRVTGEHVEVLRGLYAGRDFRAAEIPHRVRLPSLLRSLPLHDEKSPSEP
jgi:hypothetical protein